MVSIIVKDIVDEVFQDYKKPSMLIAMPTCNWKCLRELNLPLDVCQNSEICKMEDIEVSNQEIIERYKRNKITKAIIFGGLEPMDSFDDVLSLIDEFRADKEIDVRYNNIVIYTGYYEDELKENIDKLSRYANIIIKFGRFNPNLSARHDEVLGITLASENQYSKLLNKKCYHCGKETGEITSFYGKYYCKKHYNHMYRYGKIIDRTIYDLNEYIFEYDKVKIQLYDKKCNPVSIATIDKEDYGKIKDLKWYMKKPYGKNNGCSTYCVTKGINPNSSVSIQDVIMNNLDDDFRPINKYDHIDNNGLNNTKENLRIVTHQQNAMNMSKKNTNTSGVVGVSAYKNDSVLKWDSSITYSYESIWFGRSESFDEAVKLRIVGESKFKKEYGTNYNPKTNLVELTYLSHDDNKYTFISCNLDGKIVEFKKLKIIKASNYKEVTKHVKKNNQQCPCVLPELRNEDTKCVCKEFREQNHEGECHCGRYEKIWIEKGETNAED